MGLLKRLFLLIERLIPLAVHALTSIEIGLRLKPQPPEWEVVQEVEVPYEGSSNLQTSLLRKGDQVLHRRRKSGRA